MIKLMIFDFDGTLVNTIYDLGDSINEALKINGWNKEYSYVETKVLIGSGIRVLCTRALNYIEHTIEDEEKLFKDFQICYKKNQLNKTKPYEGVVDTLHKLKEQGIKIAILSNKRNENTNAITNHVFEPNLFDEVVGQLPDVPLKPNPTSVLSMIDRFGVKKEEVLYIGDSDTDMKTADNASLTKVAVTYGYRDKEVLETYKPDYMIDSFDELLDIVK